MQASYEDILHVAGDPLWYDQNGTPRYEPFEPKLCPNIYSNTVVLMEIQCQRCGKEFQVEMHSTFWNDHDIPPKQWHYGDPPRHGCVGDTMNCEDIRVIEVWHRKHAGEWKRVKKQEGKIV